MNLRITALKEKEMQKIKSFIYLDNNKMYSISSQLFNGLTEYIVKSERNSDSEKNEQKGVFSSGRLMADIIESETESTEKRFLHHYAYNLFEEELTRTNRVLEINRENIAVSSSQLDDFNFVKITNKAGFNDSKSIRDTMVNFNDLGEAFTYVQHSQDLSELKDSVQQNLKGVKDRNQRNHINNISSQKQLLQKLAKETGTWLEPKFLESLAYVLNFGYGDSFEVQMPMLDNGAYYLFSALLDRELLTEKEESITKKYSRETEKDFTLFGILTQVRKSSDKKSIYPKSDEYRDENGTMSMKEAVMNMVGALTNVERTFTGKLEYEYVIDPIAVYREI